jgi:hypothetical protein
MKRHEFYEIEVADTWYYIHIPSRIPGVYLIAAGRRSSAKRNICDGRPENVFWMV